MHVIQHLDAAGRVLKEKRYQDRSEAFDAYGAACGVADRGGGPEGTTELRLTTAGRIDRRHRPAKITVPKEAPDAETSPPSTAEGDGGERAGGDAVDRPAQPGRGAAVRPETGRRPAKTPDSVPKRTDRNQR